MIKSKMPDMSRANSFLRVYFLKTKYLRIFCGDIFFFIFLKNFLEEKIKNILKFFSRFFVRKIKKSKIPEIWNAGENMEDENLCSCVTFKKKFQLQFICSEFLFVSQYFGVFYQRNHDPQNLTISHIYGMGRSELVKGRRTFFFSA